MQIPYKINKPKLYSCSFLIKGQAHKDVNTCTRNSKNDCYSCHFPSTEGLLSTKLHYFNRHQDLNTAITHNMCSLCTAVFTANIWPHRLYLCSQTRPTALSHRIMNNINQPFALLPVCIKLRVPSTNHYANIHPVSGSYIICPLDASTLETDPMLLPTWPYRPRKQWPHLQALKKQQTIEYLLFGDSLKNQRYGLLSTCFRNGHPNCVVSHMNHTSHTVEQELGL